MILVEPSPIGQAFTVLTEPLVQIFAGPVFAVFSGLGGFTTGPLVVASALFGI